MAKSRVTFPDGTVAEISPDMSPEQIQIILATLHGNIPSQPVQKEPKTGKIIEPELTAEDIWEEGSKKEKLALFVRNHFMSSQWFNAIEVRDEQLEFVKRLVFGESSAITTYLNRLHEDGYLNKTKRGKNVYFQITTQLQDEYPDMQLHEMSELLRQD